MIPFRGADDPGGVAFAYLKVKNPDIGIIPVVLGIAGYILGPMLGVFLLGIFTKRRGSDQGNLIALATGLVATSVLGDLPGKVNSAWSIPLPPVSLVHLVRLHRRDHGCLGRNLVQDAG